MYTFVKIRFYIFFRGMFGVDILAWHGQDYIAHGSQALFTQAGFNDPSQEDASQSHFGIANANALQSQVNSFTMFYMGIQS